jgi:hypothetical protein
MKRAPLSLRERVAEGRVRDAQDLRFPHPALRATFSRRVKDPRISFPIRVKKSY